MFLLTHTSKGVIGSYEDVEEALDAMMAYIKGSDMKTKGYFRQWFDTEGTMNIDYGSHSEFFYIESRLK